MQGFIIGLIDENQYMSPVSPVFHTEVTVSIGLEN